MLAPPVTTLDNVAAAVKRGADRAVLVTGASSGIGREIARRLAADGSFVYATARKQEDLKALGALNNVQPLPLDVTRSADISAAVETITRAGRGLYGLVNNAGVATIGSIAAMDLDEFDLVMKVNAYGPVRMIKAFAPLVIAERGRIVNISSISGILAGEGLVAYSMSKHAVEALTDSLAQQLAPFGVQVSAVEPGNFNSNLVKNALARNRIDPETTEYQRSHPQSIYAEPTEVAAAVERALFEPAPKRRYLVVANEDQAGRTIRKQIQQLVQLNEGQPYTYDRAALVKMLDDALAGSRLKSS